jgi:hypothetical protein
MPITKLQFPRPGIDKQDTPYGAVGGYIDGDNVRFRYGVPEKIGGWQSVSTNNIIGMPTDIHTYTANDGTSLCAIGTNNKLYLLYNNSFYDVTPLSTTIPAVFTMTSATTLVNVLATASGVQPGDFVTFSSVSGVSVSNTNITNTTMASQFQVYNTVDANNFTINLDGLGTPGTVTTSGSAAGAAFQITAGYPTTQYGNGWSAGAYGAGTWGTYSTVSVKTYDTRIWSLNNFGQDLIATIIGGSSYYLSTNSFLSSPGFTQATLITQAPTRSNYMTIDAVNRSVVFFGTQTTPGVTTTYDPMTVLFSSQENYTDYIPTSVNTAGFQRLSHGNNIVTAVATRGNILILTNVSAHSMQYVGIPYTFGFTQVGSNCGALSSHCGVEAQNVVYWMSTNAFYRFDGTVSQIPCSVQDYVFNNINLGVASNILFAGSNSKFGEVSWFYPTAGSPFINNVVTYNYKENVWTIGSLARTTWADKDIFDYPIATQYSSVTSTTYMTPQVYGYSSTGGVSQVWYQENGYNAGSTAMTAYIQTADIPIADGDQFMFVKKIMPDFKNMNGALNVQVNTLAYPQSTVYSSTTFTVYSTTTKVDFRARGRLVNVVMKSSDLNTSWRMGTMSLEIQPDGRRG